MVLDPGIQEGMEWMIRRRSAGPVHQGDPHELLVCRCLQNGEFRVITRTIGDHCNQCDPNKCQPMTRPCVQGAFNFYAEQIRTVLAEKAGAIARERWLVTINATEDQRAWLRAHAGFDLIQPTAGVFFENSGTLYMHGVFVKDDHSYLNLPNTLGVGIRRSAT